ncbi:MAG: hypothetical protein AAGD38_04685 [Acidobacteriota bacterium]
MTYLNHERIADLLDLCHEEPRAGELASLVESLIAHHPVAARLRIELEQMLVEAGIPENVSGRFRAAVASTAALDRLLASDEHATPAILLDPDGEEGVDVGSLLADCASRLRRRQGDPERLEALAQRLQSALID